MTQRRPVAVGLALVLVALSSHALRADIRTEQKSKFEFAGMMGKLVNAFGGKGAREGVTTTVSIKGDRGAMMGEEDGRIIDLAEEKVYELNLKKKTYTVVTFAELKRRMEEARKRAEENARKTEGKPEQPAAQKDQKESQVEVDFNVKTTGEKKTINGFDTQEQVMTITVREKGKTLEQGGGMVLTVDSWIAPKVTGMKEIADFYRRYAQKVYGEAMLAGASADQMAGMMAMYPMMKQAIAKMNAEGDRVQGTPILSTMTFEGVQSEAEMAKSQEAKQQSDAESKKTPTSVGGMLGRFGSKIAAKKAGGGDESASNGRSKVMSGTTEYLKITPDVSAAEVAIPAGFKENK